MDHTGRPLTLTLPRARGACRAALLVLLVGSACGGGDDPSADAGARDGGPIDRRTPQDLDGDEWPNEVDNCAMIFNPEQRDRDRDGIGDECDNCPATPNGGANGQPTQAECAPTDEAEPNDDTPQAVTLRAAGELVAVRGNLERPSGVARPVDRFQLMLAAQTMIHLRVARAGATSLIEPEVEITGGAYMSPRRASGLFVAERDVYASAAGVYQIEVRDRRTEGAIGGELFGYELSITTVEVVPDGLTAPVTKRTVRLDPAGSIGVFTMDLTAAQRTRVLVESPLTASHLTGIDPIVVVEGPDGAHLGEGDDFLPNKRDARYFGPFPGGRARIIVDHARVVGTDDLELSMTIDQPPDNFEVEPNSRADTASPLVFPGQSRGVIDAPVDGAADVDVWSFSTTMPGAVASFRGLVDANSQVDPLLRVGRFVGDRFEVLYANTDFSGPSARVEAILPQAGLYHLVISDQRNRPGMMARGGVLFPYTVFAEPLGIQPQREVTRSGAIDGTIDQGGRLLRYLVTASVGPTLLQLETTATGVPDELTPFIRVYRPGAVGVLGEGERDVSVILPVAGTYVMGVHNAEDGVGGLGFTFSIDAQLVGLAEVPEAEPNDAAPQAVAALPAGLIGRIDPQTDVDRYALTLATGDRLTLVNHPVVADLEVALFTSGGAMPVARGAAAIAAYRAPADGTYVLQVTGGSVTDYQLAVTRR